MEHKVKIVAGINSATTKIYLDGQDISRLVSQIDFNVTAHGIHPPPNTLRLTLVPAEIEIEGDFQVIASRLIDSTVDELLEARRREFLERQPQGCRRTNGVIV